MGATLWRTSCGLSCRRREGSSRAGCHIRAAKRPKRRPAAGGCTPGGRPLVIAGCSLAAQTYSTYDIPTAAPIPTPTNTPTAANPDGSSTYDAGVSGAATPASPAASLEVTPTLFLFNNETPWPLEHPAEHDNPKLDSRLFYLALEYEEAQSAAQGVSGQATQPAAEVDVLITPDAEESIPAIVQFLKDNGASPTYAYMGLPNDGYGHYQLGATLPVSILVRLSEQSGVLFVEHPGEPGELAAPNAPSAQSQGDRNPADVAGCGGDGSE